MRRVIHGVPFIAYSPSHFVLDAEPDGSFIDFCQLWFDGHEWLVNIRTKGGRDVLKQFASRDAAIFAMGGQRHVA